MTPGATTTGNLMPDAVARVEVAAGMRLADTVRGAKNPVLVGPTEAWWATRTPDGPGSLALARLDPVTVEARAWGLGAGWLVAQAPRLLGAYDDPSGFEPPPGPLGELWRRSPFRLARTDRVWDALVGAVLGQKVQTVNARRARRALARRHGERAPGPHESWLLPPPERVAELGYHHFHPLGVERKRATILIRVAREMPRLAGLEGRPPDQFRRRLEAIAGIGPWTSAIVSAVAVGDPDAVPVGDFHLRNGVAWHLAGEPRGTDKRMLELLAPWAGHRWRVVRLVKAAGPAPRYGPRLSLHGDGLHMGR
ncbi:MAG: DNA-3-methyladenine glycosylase 2 family protein [Acidimicrobiia bacterium]|nr:DNA-3-methyladenine glycosylase 2 family protein [Acidimicrobiia bacterium]MDH4364875.1 DNA-3-methyladenine glycosylase 2 family protein [Acidimicrobiia bacterium]